MAEPTASRARDVTIGQVARRLALVSQYSRRWGSKMTPWPVQHGCEGRTDIANLPCAFGHSADADILEFTAQRRKCLILLVGAQGPGNLTLDPLIKSQLA